MQIVITPASRLVGSSGTRGETKGSGTRVAVLYRKKALNTKVENLEKNSSIDWGEENREGQLTDFFDFYKTKILTAPMAQLDSASVFGTEGYRFESYWVYSTHPANLRQHASSQSDRFSIAATRSLNSQCFGRF